jgi:hypothetical protein
MLAAMVNGQHILQTPSKEVRMNSLEQLLQFISQLGDARIQFDLKCVREAIMVALRSPSTYYEVEFFADGHIEVQTFGPPSPVQTVTVREITDRVIRDVNG